MMKMKCMALLTGILSLFAGYGLNAQNKVKAPAPVYPIPSDAQIAWHRMEMNAFVHFTTNTFTGLEWGLGSESNNVFNPTQVNTNQWVSVLKDAGFKGIILTCKHHDGFCLWPTKYTDHSIKNSPYKNGQGDIVKELSDACKAQQVKFGVYLSPWDRNRADYGTPAYIEYYRNQLKELFTTYGPVFEMWFDGANGGTGYYGGANEKRTINGASYYDWPKTLDLVRSMEPNIIFFSDAGPGVRWCGNEEGHVNETNWATISPDTLFAGKAGITDLLGTGAENGSQWIPAECDVSIRPGWFYHQAEDAKVRTPENLFQLYMTSVGRGALLLLNVPPDQRGLINDHDIAALQGFKALLQKELGNNLASKAKVEASNVRGKSKAFQPGNLTDGNPDSYWAADDQIHAATITLDMKTPKTVKYIVLQEYIKLGQRVKSFQVEYLKDGKWIALTNGTTIGYKRILQVDPVLTQKIRLNITDSRACPVLSSLEIF